MAVDLTLYAITDNSYKKLSLTEQVRAAAKGGATVIQLREKGIEIKEYAALAKALHNVTKEYGIPLIINDSVEAALISGAEGVHLGQDDQSPSEARKILGEKAIIGVTAKTVAQAVLAQREGADYLGSGAIFASPTKPDAKSISKQTLSEICSAVDIPVCAIGGINAMNVLSLKGCGISGIAVVSAVFESEITEKIISDTKKLKGLALEAVNG